MFYEIQHRKNLIVHNNGHIAGADVPQKCHQPQLS
jgi:hypothetical protein